MREEYTPEQINLFNKYADIISSYGQHISRDKLRDIDSSLLYKINKLFNSFSLFKLTYNQWKNPEEYSEYKEYDIEESYYKLQKQHSRLRNQNNELRYQNRLLLKQVNSQDNFYEYIINNLPEITYHKCIKTHINDNTELKEGTIILHLSDLHYGEVVKFGDTVYDCAIAESRLSSIISQFCIKAKNFSKAVIFVNGDLVSGTIHDEFNRTNDMVITDCVLRLSKILAESFILIKEHLKDDAKLDVVFTVGNHARTIPGGVYYKNKVKENWEYLLGEIVKRELSFTDINVEVCNTPSIVYQVEDLKLAVTHGDCFKSLSNIRVSVAKFQEMNMSTIGKFDHILIGHFHTTSIQDILGGKLFVNGSFKGFDEYSIGNNFSICYPEQTCLVINGNQITDIVILNAEQN